MYFVTFSEMMGSRGKEISEKVATELGYTHFGDLKLFEAAEKSSFLSELMDLDEAESRIHSA
jgi:hypothetical protein